MASEKKKIILRAVLTTLTGALIGWIFSNSLKNAESSSSQSGAVLRAIQNFFDVLFPGGGIVVSSHFIRKAAHFSEYALLGAMLFFTYRSYTVKCGRRFLFPHSSRRRCRFWTRDCNSSPKGARLSSPTWGSTFRARSSECCSRGRCSMSPPQSGGNDAKKRLRKGIFEQEIRNSDSRA